VARYNLLIDLGERLNTVRPITDVMLGLSVARIIGLWASESEGRVRSPTVREGTAELVVREAEGFEMAQHFSAEGYRRPTSSPFTDSKPHCGSSLSIDEAVSQLRVSALKARNVIAQGNALG
jgi:hypothetical protein